MIFFFALSLGWIAFSTGSVLAGASRRRESEPPEPAAAGHLADGAGDAHLQRKIPRARPRRCRRWRRPCSASMRIAQFEIVMLSDSTDADAWIRETLKVAKLRAALHSIMPVWYRRRWQNVARKSSVSRTS